MARVEPTDDQMRAQFETAKRDIGVLFGMMRDRAAAMAERARASVAETFPETSEEAAGFYADAKTRGAGFYADAKDAATKNPMAAAGVAAAAGFVLARMLRR